MALEFRTKETSGDTTSIGGVGLLAAWGANGIPIVDAAQTMHELQDRYGDPLDGAALEKAARKWADARGLVVFDAKDRPNLQRKSASSGEPDGSTDPNAEEQEEAKE